MKRLYRGFDIIRNRLHTSNQQRQFFGVPLSFDSKSVGIFPAMLRNFNVVGVVA
ncbi:hypothetical protein [Nodularia sp. NIES-3585]|uniref:hypothetical protein n=1 Tax=Nodularia sp. NIES-3585 TaxID=1973477 RepID=UPI001595F3B4|nr:hypothetical protein [Nodularia sp. NIES-3585]